MATPPGNDFGGLSELWHSIGSQMQLLGISGAAGAIFRAVVYPDRRWKRRAVQGFAGVLSAIFLGGVTANAINAVIDAGAYAYLCAGFLVGSGGELAVRALQDRFLGAPEA
jgi:hypothetical protein